MERDAPASCFTPLLPSQPSTKKHLVLLLSKLSDGTCWHSVSSSALLAGKAMAAAGSFCWNDKGRVTRVYQDSPRSQAADGATEGQAGKGIGSATPPVSTEGSRHPTVPSQLLLLCHQLSRDTNWPFKGGPHPKNESVKAVCLYTLTLSYCPQR